MEIKPSEGKELFASLNVNGKALVRPSQTMIRLAHLIGVNCTN